MKEIKNLQIQNTRYPTAGEKYGIYEVMRPMMSIPIKVGYAWAIFCFVSSVILFIGMLMNLPDASKAITYAVVLGGMLIITAFLLQHLKQNKSLLEDIRYGNYVVSDCLVYNVADSLELTGQALAWVEFELGDRCKYSFVIGETAANKWKANRLTKFLLVCCHGNYELLCCDELTK